MTEITHHLTDDLLMDYATGTLPEGFALVVATHVSLCDDCRARLAAYEALGGSVLERAEAVALEDRAFEATMARIAGLSPAPRPAARPRHGLFPAPLQDYVGGDLAAVRWRPLGLGVRQAVLPTDGSAKVRLLYIPAGAAVPDHGHRGRELTLVLQGAFRDDEGRFGPGDVEVGDEELEHTPVAEAGQDCICLAATDALLKFRGIMPRLAQPFFRI
ncbi:transcriptional regulator [Candidatus Falkowbacteria bacterium]|nr:transcriptional regulator [Candidatus Falkowbacteria bacterium]